MSDGQFMYASAFVVVYWVSVILLLANIARARSFGDMVVAIPETAATASLLIAAIPLAVYVWLALAAGIAVRPYRMQEMIQFMVFWGVVSIGTKVLAWVLRKSISSKDAHGQPAPVRHAVRTVKTLLIVLILFLAATVLRNPLALMRE